MFFLFVFFFSIAENALGTGKIFFYDNLFQNCNKFSFLGFFLLFLKWKNVRKLKTQHLKSRVTDLF